MIKGRLKNLESIGRKTRISRHNLWGTGSGQDEASGERTGAIPQTKHSNQRRFYGKVLSPNTVEAYGACNGSTEAHKIQSRFY